MTPDYLCDVILSVLGVAVLGNLLGVAWRLMTRARPRREP